MTARYNIYAFKWVNELNTFMCENPIPGIHPIDRKQFYIVNNDTGGFRRFEYMNVIDIDGVAYNNFKSEDDILCAVKIIK